MAYFFLQGTGLSGADLPIDSHPDAFCVFLLFGCRASKSEISGTIWNKCVDVEPNDNHLVRRACRGGFVPGSRCVYVTPCNAEYDDASYPFAPTNYLHHQRDNTTQRRIILFNGWIMSKCWSRWKSAISIVHAHVAFAHAKSEYASSTKAEIHGPTWRHDGRTWADITVSGHVGSCRPVMMARRCLGL